MRPAQRDPAPTDLRRRGGTLALPITGGMAGERTIGGSRLTLASRDSGRYASGIFLGSWLCGWAVGEAFALRLIPKAIALLSGPSDPGHTPPGAGPLIGGAFLLLFLALWTLAGLASLAVLLRLLWGEDRIEVSPDRLVVTRLRGPFRTTRRFERGAIRRVLLAGRDDRLTLETARGRFTLSRLGTRAERFEGVAALRAELGILESAAGAATMPRGWEQIITPEGERVVVVDLATRGIQAWGAGAGALLLAAVTFVVARESLHRPDLVLAALLLLAFTVGLAAGTLWLARGRWEWRIGSGRLTLRKRFAGTVRDVFEAKRLVLEVSTDSDGDEWYALEALPAVSPPLPAGITIRTSFSNRRTVARRMNDGSGVRDLGAWLARATGLEFIDRTAPHTCEVRLDDLRVMLEKSGPMGQWAAEIVDRLDRERRKSK